MKISPLSHAMLYYEVKQQHLEKLVAAVREIRKGM
jgi:hypothetical protein